MVDHIQQGGEASIMVETAFRVGPQVLERRGPVAMVRRPVCLEGIDADFFGRMQVPARFRVQGWNMAARTLCFPLKKRISTCSCLGIEASLRRPWCQ